MSRTVESVAVNLASRIDSLYAENVGLVHALNCKKQYIEALHARASVRVQVAELLIQQLRRAPETAPVTAPTSPLEANEKGRADSGEVKG